MPHSARVAGEAARIDLRGIRVDDYVYRRLVSLARRCYESPVASSRAGRSGPGPRLPRRSSEGLNGKATPTRRLPEPGADPRVHRKQRRARGEAGDRQSVRPFGAGQDRAEAAASRHDRRRADRRRARPRLPQDGRRPQGDGAAHRRRRRQRQPWAVPERWEADLPEPRLRVLERRAGRGARSASATASSRAPSSAAPAMPRTR
jgi:hypothetical protein